MPSWISLASKKALQLSLAIFAVLPFLSHFAFAQAQNSPAPQAAANTELRLPFVGAPIIQNFDAKTYKAHSQNWVAVQDKRGVMFVGNSTGLLEFDGQRWQIVPTVGNPMVRALTIAPDDTIFYGSIGDFGYIRVSPSGRATAISLKDLIPKDGLVFNDVWQVEATTQGVYFLTRSHIFRYFEGKVTTLKGKFASSQAIVINDNLIYADIEKGLCFIDGDQIVPIPQLAGVANGKRIMLGRYGTHELLAARLTGDFKRINLAPLWDEKSKRYLVSRAADNLVQSFPTEVDGVMGLEQLYAYKLLALGDSGFALSTAKGGIFILDRTGKIQRVLNKKAGLIDSTVAGLFLDRSKNLWALSNSGISHIELNVPQASFGSANGVDGITISAAYYKGRLYLGSYQHIMVESPFSFSAKSEVPQFVPLQKGPSEIWQFREVDGDLMVPSGQGLFQIDGDTAHRVEGSSGNAYSLGTTPRWPHHVFVGLMDGVEVFKKEDGKWKLLGRLQGVKENVRRITTDADGELWLNTEVHGVLRAHFNGENATQIALHRIGLEHGLPDLANSRTSFFADTLFIQSPKGLLSAKPAPWQDGDKDRTHFKPDARFGTQYSDGSLALTEMNSDGKDGVLLKTAEGVHWLTPDGKGKYKAITAPFKGLSSPDESLFVHPDGSVWFTGENVYRIDLTTPKDGTQKFNALIRKVAANTKELIFEGTHASTGKHFSNELTSFLVDQNSKNVMQLAYRQNALYFEFAAPYFEKLGTMQFQFQLDGFDKDWSSWDTVTSKEYTNIPEGSYRFRVRAKNIYGTISEENSYAFQILPPWYRTLWAYALWVSIFIASVVGIIYLYTLRLRINKRMLEKEIIARTSEAIEQREVAEKARHDIALLSEMGRQITASLDVDAIEKSLYEYVKQLVPGDTFGIGIVDWEKRSIHFDFVIEYHKQVEPYRRSLDAKEQPATQCVLYANELLINSLALDTRELDSVLSQEYVAQPLVKREGDAPPIPRSAIYVPMLLQEKVIGVICVQSEFVDAFHENDLVILRSLGSYAAVALDNAESYRRLKETQTKLVEQEKLAALGSIVAGVAHELNTPLGNSLLTASSLNEMTAGFLNEVQSGTIRRSKLEVYSEKVKSACEILLRNLSTAANLITSFKQIAVDQTSDQRRKFDLLTVTTEIVHSLANRLRREDHSVQVNIPTNITLDSFPGPFEQVLSNLILNAITHAFAGTKGGTIYITYVEHDANTVTMLVTDNGCGISEQNIGRIFDPFFTTRMGQGGSGLGLHITYNIVTGILGGTITVDSHLGEGTQFTLIIPLIAPQK